MASDFWDRNGILLVDFMPKINIAACCGTLTGFQQAIQNKRRGMLSCSVCLLHDNAWPHSTHVITALVEIFKWGIVEHLPYIPDLAPRNFHLFLHLKKHLSGLKFNDDHEVEQEVMTWFKG